MLGGGRVGRVGHTMSLHTCYDVIPKQNYFWWGNSGYKCLRWGHSLLQGDRSNLHDSSEVGQLRQGGGEVGLGVLEPQELYTHRDKRLSNAILNIREMIIYMHVFPKCIVIHSCTWKLWLLRYYAKACLCWPPIKLMGMSKMKSIPVIQIVQEL